MRRLVLPLVLVVVLSLAIAAASSGGGSSRPVPATVSAGSSSLAPAEIAVGTLERYATAVTASQVGQYLAARSASDLAAFLASLRPPVAVEPSSPSVPAAGVTGSAGGCSGFSVPDWIIQRESGGDPNAVNPSSGAYGCTQTLPEHYQAGGACAGLDMHSVDGQRQCTYILSAGGTNLAAWSG